MISALAVAVNACTHTMNVRNLNQYVKHANSPRKLIVSLEDGSRGSEQKYFSFVHEALATHPDVSRVMMAGEAQPDAVPDVVVKVTPQAKYNGSGWNYLITFPGFALFAHAWNGYVYSADLVTEVEVSTPGSPEVARSNITTTYNMRHCDFERGAWTSSGWYTPGWGGLNLIIGFFMVNYDEDSTPAFQKEIRSAYGQFIANSIIETASARLEARGSSTGEPAICATFDPWGREFRLGCG